MIRDITLGQYYQTDSVLHRLDCRVKLVGTLAFIISLFVVNNVWGYLLAALFLALCIRLSNVPFKFMVKGMKSIVFLMLFAVVFNLFLTPGTPAVTIWKLKITWEGIEMASKMAVRLVMLIIGSSLMTLTTTPNHLTDGLESLLNPLKKLKVPVHEVSMMMSIALRFIPILLEETDKIMKAQIARGADFENGSLIQRAKAMVPLLVPLFIAAFRRANDLAMAMEARCYRGGEGRTKMKPLVYGLWSFGRLSGGSGSDREGASVMETMEIRKKRRICLVVAYDGTNYQGWQIQQNGNTIEAELNRALSALTKEPIEVSGASRTDSGVHSRCNYAVFDTAVRMPGDKFSYALNQRLPEDIRVRKSYEVSPHWHPRKCSSKKTYEYRIFNDEFPDPLCRLYTHFTYTKLDIDRMNAAAGYLIGEHDFKSFCSIHTQTETTVRTITDLSVKKEGSLITIRVTGTGFLYNMVRIIAGTLMEVGNGKYPPEHIKEILQHCDRSCAGPTAPARGLTLVEYEFL